MENTLQPQEQRLKLFSVFTGLFCAVLVVSNVAAVKLIPFGPFTIVGGTLLFPIIFIFNDILTEVYGYNLSRKVIWTGFLCEIIAAIAFYIVGILPAASFWPHQDAYLQILGVVPRIVFASIVAYFCSEFTNSLILSKMKWWGNGKRGLSQAWRFIASTIVGEAVDSIVFVTIAFVGILHPSELLNVILGAYVFKVAFEIIATPLSVPFSNWVKKNEGVDHLDQPEKTSYNPFVIFKS